MMSDPVLEARPILERFRLDGRVALVTGGGQGIGRAFAHALGEAGAAVAVVDLRLDLAEEVAHELTAKQIDAIALQADVTKPEQVQAMVDAILAKWRTLTIGVNNAGIGLWADAESMAYADWLRDRHRPQLGLPLRPGGSQSHVARRLRQDHQHGVDVRPHQQHAAEPIRLQHGQGGRDPPDAQPGRRMGEARGARQQHQPRLPRTKLVDDLLATPIGQTMLPTWMGMTPMGRMAEVTDLQGAVVYLASSASDYMTGHDMVIDGGYCCW